MEPPPSHKEMYNLPLFLRVYNIILQNLSKINNEITLSILTAGAWIQSI